MSSNSPWVKLTASEIIQCPHTSSAIATAMAFGTKERVGSWICVIDWNTEIAKPTTSEVTSSGAASSPASSSAWSARSMTWFWVTGASRSVALHERRDDQAPAVDEDEEQDLERQRDHRRRQHHHAHRHQAGRDDEVDHEERHEDDEADDERGAQLREHER